MDFQDWLDQANAVYQSQPWLVDLMRDAAIGVASLTTAWLVRRIVTRTLTEMNVDRRFWTLLGLPDGPISSASATANPEASDGTVIQQPQGASTSRIAAVCGRAAWAAILLFGLWMVCELRQLSTMASAIKRLGAAAGFLLLAIIPAFAFALALSRAITQLLLKTGLRDSLDQLAPSTDPDDVPFSTALSWLMAILIYGLVSSVAIVLVMEAMGWGNFRSGFLPAWTWLGRLLNAAAVILIGWIGLTWMKRELGEAGNASWARGGLILLTVLLSASSLIGVSLPEAAASAGSSGGWLGYMVMVLMLALAGGAAYWMYGHRSTDVAAGLQLKLRAPLSMSISGERATVVSIGWFDTTLRFGDDDQVIWPNERVLKILNGEPVKKSKKSRKAKSMETPSDEPATSPSNEPVRRTMPLAGVDELEELDPSSSRASTRSRDASRGDAPENDEPPSTIPLAP